MDIDIDSLTVEELEMLNHKIVERLKFLDTVSAHEAMMRFRPGARVCFDSSRHGQQSGTLMKYNQKTVTVLTDEGRRWNVPPQMLSLLKKEGVMPANVIDIKKHKSDL